MAGEAALPPPVVLALVLSEGGQYDSEGAKYSIFGTLPVFGSRTFPCRLPSLCVYVVLTNGRGEMVVTVRLVDVDEQRKPLFRMEMLASFPDPTSVVDFMFVVPGITLPEPGEYRVQASIAGQLLAERRLVLIETEGSSG